MPLRGPYRTYYDITSNAKIPESTIRSRKKIEHVVHVNKKRKYDELQNDQIGMNIFEFDQMYANQESNNIEDSADQIPDEADSSKSNDSMANFSIHKRSEQTKYNKNKDKEIFSSNVCVCGKTNFGEALLIALKIAEKYVLPWTILLDIFQMIDIITGKHIMPRNKQKLKKILYNVNTENVTYHVYCPTCNHYFGKRMKSKKIMICICGTEFDCSNSFFMEIDVKDQLKNLLADKKIVDALDYKNTRVKMNEDGLEDIYDGQLYKKLEKENFFKSKYNFSYTLNTDGCQAADCSKITVWPIFLMINELPPDVRRKRMILAGLWVARAEPDMVMFLDPFVTQANQLFNVGFEWNLDSQIIISKLAPLGCCVDTPARAAMLHMKRFNGEHGCTYCEHPTVSIDNVRKYPMLEKVPILRTNESIKQNMIMALHSKKDVTGVWGPSPLMNLQCFDLVKGMIVDFMHACLLGVIQLLMTILFSNPRERYYIGSPAAIDIIDKRLKKITPPSCIGVVPRSTKERNVWKAKEWLMWLVFYSIPCLKGVLHTKYLRNLAKFSVAMSILLEDSITIAMLNYARKLLIEFVVEFESLYGKQYMNYNVHLLLHLPDSVRNIGPLWSESTFPFESENKCLLEKKKSNHRISEQIVNRTFIYQKIPILENEKCISDRIKLFCTTLCEKRLKNTLTVNNCTLIGLGKAYLSTEPETECLNKLIDVSSIIECKKFNRIIYEGIRYTSLQYLRSQKTNNSIVQLKNGKVGAILKICMLKHGDLEDVIIFIKEFSIMTAPIINDPELNIYHIRECNIQQGSVVAYECSSLYRSALLVKRAQKYFILTIPKGCLGKLH